MEIWSAAAASHAGFGRSSSATCFGRTRPDRRMLCATRRFSKKRMSSEARRRTRDGALVRALVDNGMGNGDVGLSRSVLRSSAASRPGEERARARQSSTTVASRTRARSPSFSSLPHRSRDGDRAAFDPERIGAGIDCDGQVLVFTTCFGLYGDFKRVAKRYAEIGTRSSTRFGVDSDVREGRFRTRAQLHHEGQRARRAPAEVAAEGRLRPHPQGTRMASRYRDGRDRHVIQRASPARRGRCDRRTKGRSDR